MQEDTQAKLVSAVKTALQQLDYDVTRRNDYMNVRDRALYGDGLYHDLDIEEWFAEYNYCSRVIDIHSAQLMGRGFTINSYYNKEDIPSAKDLPPDQADQLDTLVAQAETQNKLKKGYADARKRSVLAMIRDNGGFDPFKRGARIGSAIGNTVYKAWFDKNAMKWTYVLIENVHSYRRGWTDNNFREADFDSYIYQISVDKANRLYKSKLKPGETFETSQQGDPFTDAFSGGKTDDPISQSSTDGRPKETARPMVTVIDFTGYLTGHDGNGACELGEEKPFNVLIVGGNVVQTITEEDRLPRYYFIANRVEPRRAWGRSDLPQSALDINKEIIQLMSDQITWANKNLYKLIQAKGFTAASIPKKKARKQQVVAMAPEQSLEEMGTSFQSIAEWDRLVNSRIEAFVRMTGVGRVLFDDPSVNANSNQALMTTLKSVVDIVEDKQSRWEPEILRMFTDGLKISAKFIPNMKAYVLEDTDWYLLMEWPSVLRREDATYQTMWLNLFNAGIISVDTYHDKIGITDSSEEIDRIKDNMKNYVTAAMMGHGLSEVAHQTLNKELNIPAWGYVVPKVQLKGELAPQEVGNMSNKYGWDQGPYGDGISKMGFNADTSSLDPTPEQALNLEPTGPAAPQQPNPQMTTDNNTGAAPTSQPGSGATAVSPAGAVAQVSQNGGR